MFSKSVQYALRLAACVALHQGKTALRGSEIAERTGVPPAYASKVLRKLVSAGVLRGEKGHGGGFTLARPPSKICLADVLDGASVEVRPRTCVFGLKACSERNPCVLHHRWKDLKDQVRTWAVTTTLGDIIKDNSMRGKIFADLCNK